MDLSKFDVKKFLSLPVNNGKLFIDEDSCGCLKGNFFRAVGINDIRQILAYVSSFHQGSPSSFYQTDPLLLKILDRGEFLHMHKHKPQYAKLFTLRALRMFKLLPAETIPELAKQLCEV